MKTILTIKRINEVYKTVAVVDIDEFDIENKIKFIAAILDIEIKDARTYYDLFKELNIYKSIIISDGDKGVYLKFDEIAEY